MLNGMLGMIWFVSWEVVMGNDYFGVLDSIGNHDTFGAVFPMEVWHKGVFRI